MKAAPQCSCACLAAACALALGIALAARAQTAPTAPPIGDLGDKGAPRPRADIGDALQLTDLWQGTYEYPAGRPEPPVEFELLLLHDVKTGKLAGHIREPRSFGLGANPWTHAGVRGAFDPQRGTITFTKQYDGANGIHHAVLYAGQLAPDALTAAGTWTIDDQAGRFELHRKKIAAYVVSRPDGPGPAASPQAAVNFTDACKGSFAYATGSPRPPVDFEVVVLHDAATGKFIGRWREPATFGAGPDPYLYATITGQYDAAKRSIVWTKEYDGTNRVDDSVEFTGQLGVDGQRLSGKWTRDDGSAGTFEMAHDAGAWRDPRRPQRDAPNNRPARQ